MLSRSGRGVDLTRSVAVAVVPPIPILLHPRLIIPGLSRNPKIFSSLAFFYQSVDARVFVISSVLSEIVFFSFLLHGLKHRFVYGKFLEEQEVELDEFSILIFPRP